MNETREFIEEISRLNTEIMNNKQTSQRLVNALAVFVLDAKLHNYLKANDPKALEQAINAINGFDPKLIDGKLPHAPSKIAYVLVPGNQPGKRIAKAKYNESGYFTTDAFDPGSEDEAREIVNRLNAEIGVTPEVSEAFLAGSMFGWHVPASNPAHAYLGQPLRVPGAAVKPDPPEITEQATCPECGSHNIRVRVDAYAFYDLAGFDNDGEAVANNWDEPDDVSTFDDRDYVCVDCDHESHSADNFIGDPVIK